MKRSFELLATLIVGFAICLLLNTCGNNSFTPPALSGNVKPDTIRILKVIRDTIQVIPPAKRYLPRTVKTYLKPDTARRAAVEKDTIFTGLIMKGNTAELQTLTPRGLSHISAYELPGQMQWQITIDRKGNLELAPDEALMRKQLRQKKWRKIGNWCLIGLAFVAGAAAGSNI
ncbi:MAG: hypothetical protein V4543_00620 [Bacteroidota bacterium]